MNEPMTDNRRYNSPQKNMQSENTQIGTLTRKVLLRDEKIQSLKDELSKLRRQSVIDKSRIRFLEYNNFKMNRLITASEGGIKKDNDLCDIAKNIVNRHFGVDIDFRIRTKSVIMGRMMYYKLIRNHTSLSLNEISTTIACSPHHSTIIWALQTHEEYMQFDKQYQRDWKEVVATFDMQNC